VEGIPAFGNALPFAGRRRNEGLGRFMRTAGTSSPQYDEPATQRGARVDRLEEGNLRPRRSAAAGGAREGPSLSATRPTQSSAVVQRPSPQTVVGSRRRPQAALRSEDGFRGLVLRRACSVVEPASEGLSRFAVFVILLREGKVASLKQAWRERAQIRRHCPSSLVSGATRRVRKPAARECVRASEVSCRSRWAVAGSREAPVGASREQREAGRWAGTGI
jgi:hypothetical protein